MSAPSNPDDELHDLSPEDAGELRAFLEKRRWFEAKLRILESLPPIYPFLHPELSPAPSSPQTGEDGNGIRYKHFEGSQWALPTTEEIKAWQEERTALEEQVLAFDGGDLGRMKEKTRAATLLPLTPPSTHLVSITLALIVLIDRLLHLLRQRSELLQLTKLRLQWDGMRWQIQQETEQIRLEIAEIARGKGRWIPPAVRPSTDSHTPRRGRYSIASAVLTGEEGLATTPAVAVPSTASASTSIRNSISELSLNSLTPSKSSTSLSQHHRRDSSISISSLRDTPKRSFHLPLLHSHIVNLEIRHKNLTSTALVRSGKTLDKMIDVAIPLQCLGGVNGPSPNGHAEPGEGGGGGAVPEELLDIQDDLEMGVGDLTKQVEWCKALEEQWKRADAHYLASVSARETAESLLETLVSSLGAPVSAAREQYQYLESLHQSAKNSLPTPIDSDFPRPTHPSYPDHGGHTSGIIDALTTARAEAEAVIAQCSDGIAWYGKLSDATQKLDTIQGEVICATETLQAPLLRITPTPRQGETGETLASRPDLSKPDSLFVGDTSETWLNGLPSHLNLIRTQQQSLQDHNQRFTLALMKYRNLGKAPPTSIRDIVQSPPNDLADQAERVEDEATDLLQRTAQAVKEAELDGAILPIVLDVGKARDRLTTELTHLREEMDSDSITEENLGIWSTRLREIQHGREQDVVASRAKLEDVMRSQNRLIPPLWAYLDTKSQTLDEQLSSTSQRYYHARRMFDQQSVVDAIEREAAVYLDRIHVLRDQISDSDSGLSSPCHPRASDVENVSREIGTWENGIAERAIFLSDRDPQVPIPPPDETSFASSRQVTSLLSASTSSSAPPMTPPASPPPPPTSMILPSDTAVTGSGPSPIELDSASRGRINEAVLRVKSTLLALQAKVKQPRSTSDASAEDSHLQLEYEEEPNHIPLDSPPPPVIPQEDQNDVFGTLSVVQQGSSASQTPPDTLTVQQLRDRFDSLHVERLVYPHLVSSGASQVTPSVRQIPSSPEARRVKDGIRAISQDLSILLGTISHSGNEGSDSEVEALKLTLEHVEANIPRLDALVQFGQAVKGCDTNFSRLLDLIDEVDSDSASSLHFDALIAGKSKTEQAVVKATEASVAVYDDPRVVSESKRIINAWAELSALVHETLHPEKQAMEEEREDSVNSMDDSLSGISEDSIVSPITYLPTSRLPHPTFPSRSSASSGSSRVASNPIAIQSRLFSAEPRNRAVSDTPTRNRVRVDSMRSGLPVLKKQSTGPNNAFVSGMMSPTPSTPRAGPSSIPRPARTTPIHYDYGASGRDKTAGPETPSARAATSKNSHQDLGLGMMTPRARTMSRRMMTSSQKGRRKTYVANPTSKLDVAVGKIVNKLRVDIPIRPVGVDTSDEWKDQSGKYWIGAEGRAKLCFCRILRSRTVMVRVGGGWVELSKFLMDHFADSLGSWTAGEYGFGPGGGGFGIGIGSSVPIPITSASVAASAATSTKAPVSMTPARTRVKTTGTSAANAADAAPVLTTAAGAVTPVRTAHSGIKQETGPASELVSMSLPLSQSQSLSFSGTAGTQLVTPQRDYRASTLSPASSNGGGSPLIPLHFMKKASESPEVREREKEKLKAGRRSILGRQNSGLG